MKDFIITAFLLFTGISAMSQDSWIKWEENKTLQWNDFAGKVLDTSKFDAECYAFVCYDYTFYNANDFQFTVYAKFDKNTSWRRNNVQSEALLKHEQLHFDIAQYFAAKLNAQFNNFHYSSNYKDEIIQLFDKIKVEYALMEQEYDRQTNHSLNKEKQKEWEDFLSAELRKVPQGNQYVKATAKQP